MTMTELPLRCCRCGKTRVEDIVDHGGPIRSMMQMNDGRVVCNVCLAMGREEDAWDDDTEED